MALTGLDIYKLLPKTNCGECKSPTCLAFAMRVAQKQAALALCRPLQRGVRGTAVSEVVGDVEFGPAVVVQVGEHGTTGAGIMVCR